LQEQPQAKVKIEVYVEKPTDPFMEMIAQLGCFDRDHRR